MDGARAEIDQAGVRPNPTLGVEAENFAGTGGFSVLEQPEVTVTYEQRIERGGKREARLAYASRGLDLAEAQARLRDRKSVVAGQRVSVRVDLGGRRSL